MFKSPIPATSVPKLLLEITEDGELVFFFFGDGPTLGEGVLDVLAGSKLGGSFATASKLYVDAFRSLSFVGCAAAITDRHICPFLLLRV